MAAPHRPSVVVLTHAAAAAPVRPGVAASPRFASLRLAASDRTAVPVGARWARR